MQNIYTIKSRLAELREELMNHAAAWSDVPGGTDNPIAQAEYARIWKELETLCKRPMARPTKWRFRRKWKCCITV